jgi:hypothetical protein
VAAGPPRLPINRIGCNKGLKTNNIANKLILNKKATFNPEGGFDADMPLEHLSG